MTGERRGPREHSPWTLPPCCSKGNEFQWNNFGKSWRSLVGADTKGIGDEGSCVSRVKRARSGSVEIYI